MRSSRIIFASLAPMALMTPASAQSPAFPITQRQHQVAEAAIIQSVLRSRQPRPDHVRFRDVRRVVVLALPTRDAPLYGYCGYVTSKDGLGVYRPWQRFFAWTAQLGSTPHVSQTDVDARNAPYEAYCNARAGTPIRFGEPLASDRTPPPFDLDAVTVGSMLAGSLLILALGAMLLSAFQAAARALGRRRAARTPLRLEGPPAVNLRAEDLLADDGWPGATPPPRAPFRIDRQWRRWPGRGGSDRRP